MVATLRNIQELLKYRREALSVYPKSPAFALRASARQAFPASRFTPSPRLRRAGGGQAAYTDGMLKGSKKAVITKIQPVSIHGQVSLDIYFLDPDDMQGQASRARIGQESVPRSIEAGDHVELHYVLGVVTHVTKI
jgi:hypothetical protein